MEEGAIIAMAIEQFLSYIALFFEGVGLLFVIMGGIIAIGKIGIQEFQTVFRIKHKAHGAIRTELLQRMLFGLDFIIASDIVRSILTPTRDELLVLASIVGIRTILAYFLSKEILASK